MKDRDELSGIDENFWNVARANLSTVAKVKEWWHICKEEVVPVIDDEDDKIMKERQNISIINNLIIKK